jgi:hypothetical protein
MSFGRYSNRKAICQVDKLFTGILITWQPRIDLQSSPFTTHPASVISSSQAFHLYPHHVATSDRSAVFAIHHPSRIGSSSAIAVARLD